MPRLDVYRNSGAHADATPYVLDVQSDLLDALGSRVVIPLRRLERFADVRLPMPLMPVFDVEGRPCVLDTPRLAAVPRHVLQDLVGSLASDERRIDDALDFLCRGFGAR